MRHVRQINDHDCGIAVAAMLTGFSYRAVVRAAEIDPHRAEGLYVTEMKALLAELTDRPWRESRCGHHRRLTQARGLGARYALVIGARIGQPFGHWIALDRGTAYDPELPEPMPLDDYPLRHWRVLRAVMPGLLPCR
jgi:hypothetical protein